MPRLGQYLRAADRIVPLPASSPLEIAAAVTGEHPAYAEFQEWLFEICELKARFNRASPRSAWHRVSRVPLQASDPSLVMGTESRR